MRKRLESFYAEEMYAEDNSSPSARIVVPMLVELIHPSSVLDVGCGRGAWLKAFISNGIENVIGLDGDYIKPSRLMFPAERFRPTNLSATFEIPSERFDLATCLEVAEHLPERNAKHLVKQLTSAAPHVLFSAAPPGQKGGGHINCQPITYWRKVFEEFGFKLLDPFRPRLRDDRRVAWWYRQNMVFFVSRDAITANPRLAECGEAPPGLESEWVYMWTAGPHCWPAAERQHRLARRLMQRAKRALRPNS
jgi:SAM-dependent methyltransferase